MKAFAEWIETFIVPSPRSFIVLSLGVVTLALAVGLGLVAVLI